MTYGEARITVQWAKDRGLISQLPPNPPNKNQVNGRLGGLIGGPARAAKMTAEERHASAQHAARARWLIERKMAEEKNSVTHK